MSKVIRGLALTGVTTIEQHLKICKVCGDENNNMSQHDIDEELAKGDTLFYDNMGDRKLSMYFWGEHFLSDSLKYYSYEEFLNKFDEPILDISKV